MHIRYVCATNISLFLSFLPSLLFLWMLCAWFIGLCIRYSTLQWRTQAWLWYMEMQMTSAVFCLQVSTYRAHTVQGSFISEIHGIKKFAIFWQTRRQGLGSSTRETEWAGVKKNREVPLTKLGATQQRLCTHSNRQELQYLPSWACTHSRTHYDERKSKVTISVRSYTLCGHTCYNYHKYSWICCVQVQCKQPK